MKLQEIIAQQQKGHEGKPRFMIGEQLKEIAAREPKSAELIEQDLQVKEMSLEAAERAFQAYANQHKGNAKTFCITPIVAEGILRKFYGLPEAGQAPEEPKPQEGYIDLSSYL